MPGFQSRSEQIDPSTIKTHVEWNGAPVAMSDAFGLLARDAGFRDGLIASLQAAPFAGYFWETPPVTKRTSHRHFEFVSTDAPAFQRVGSERSAFAEYFSNDPDRDGVVTFENLGRNATLVVPCSSHEDPAYAHLAAFVRNGPTSQVHALFKAVGEAAARRLSDRPQWLSTAGLGVYWLHVRLDSTPKYYRHGPYKTAPRSE